MITTESTYDMKMDKTTTSHQRESQVSESAAQSCQLAQDEPDQVFLPWSRERVHTSRQRDHVSRSRLCLWRGSELASGLKAQPRGHWLNGIEMVLVEPKELRRFRDSFCNLRKV